MMSVNVIRSVGRCLLPQARYVKSRVPDFQLNSHLQEQFFIQISNDATSRCLPSAAETKVETDPQQPTPTVKVLFDGECNICMHEIRMLQRIARRKPVDFVDISTADFTEDKYGGVTYEMAMKEMHIIGADGKVHVQADAVREMYTACGLGWMASLTRLPVVDRVFDSLYMQYAHYRLNAALDRCESGVSCSIKLKHLKDKLRSRQT